MNTRVQHLQLVKEVDLGPQSQVIAMNKYCVNGFKFQTKEVSRNKKTNNSAYIQGDVDGNRVKLLNIMRQSHRWVVIKSKPVGRIEIDNVLDVWRSK
ncbi:hypothetical protein H5410_036484 [Solanum commersonii]|uniref:Uncharacterized protein n=1 Tax=Solanum commersonii TaxID=4109 RepID=A0A9J5Y7L2_SOLCO|nr:hypothetical protein H5410_036484 [Solanum commersonii]